MNHGLGGERDASGQKIDTVWRDFGEFYGLEGQWDLLRRQDGVYSVSDFAKKKDMCLYAATTFWQNADASHAPDVF